MENQVSIGMNRTGQQMAPLSRNDMTSYARAHALEAPADQGGYEALHRAYIEEAERIGSVPIPGTLRGMATTGFAKLKGDKPEVFIDKLGERLAFERTGTRLYEALILKCTALASTAAQGARSPVGEEAEPIAAAAHSGDSPVAVSEADAAVGAGAGPAPARTADESGRMQIDLYALKQIRDEEESHFHLVHRAIESLGADPTAMTPCADVAGVMASGLLQTVTDPRTSVAQSLNAILAAELSDNAGWELLIDIAEELGHRVMVKEFAAALETEQTHLATVRGWLRKSLLAEMHA